MRDVPLDELLKRCANRDAHAWNEMVQRHRALVWSVPLRLGMDQADAAEVFQDVFESLLRNVESLQDPGRLSSWLFTAARRLSLRRLSARRRDDRREVKDDEVLHGVGDGQTPLSERLVAAERQGKVLRLLEGLPERCRELLTALFLDPDEPDYDKIAARLGIPRGSIGPTRSRCLKRLHDDLRLQEDSTLLD